MNKNVAYVIGNGKSRANINLDLLKPHGNIYGCNALYRDFTPDVLVATDQGIAKEIENTGYPMNNTFYTRRPNVEQGSKEIPTQWKGWSSGPVSVALALEHGHRVIYLVGHDFGSVDRLFNNCYAGTENYREVGSAPTYAGNWVNQLKTLLGTFKYSKIIRVTGPESAKTPKFDHEPNYSEIDISSFVSSINN